MLPEVQHQFQNPEDIPAIPPACSLFLQARLNPLYLHRAGVLDDLRAKGFSEQALLGVIEGVNIAVELIEFMEMTQVQLMEDQQVT